MIMPLVVVVIVAVAIVGTYYAVGPAAGVTAISVDTSPVKGGVTVDGVSWGTAPVSREVDPGTYTVTFGAVTDYTTPASQTVTVASGETKSISVSYVSVTPEKLKVAFALPGYLSDASWNAAMYVSAHEIADEFDLDIAISEGLGWEGVESTLIYYASEGYDIIVCHSGGQQDIANRVAPDYPDTIFLGSTFVEFDAPNVIGFTDYAEELGYIAGIVAGGVSKSGIIGYIHGAEFLPIRVDLNGYIMGAQLMNPDIKVLRAFTGVFEDLTKGMETALAMLDAGADVINPGGDGLTLGAIQAIHSRNTKEDPRYAIGFITDQNSIAPGTVLSTKEFYFTVMLRDLITKYKEGTLEGGREYLYGLKDNAIGLAPFHELEDVVPQETKDALDKAIEDIIAGTLEVPFITDYVIET
jgi:basic membrane protein A